MNIDSPHNIAYPLDRLHSMMSTYFKIHAKEVVIFRVLSLHKLPTGRNHNTFYIIPRPWGVHNVFEMVHYHPKLMDILY